MGVSGANSTTLNYMDEAQLSELILQPESLTLELKSDVSDPWILARLISGFANAHGGKIIVGVRESGQVLGCDIKRLQQVLSAALQRINPKPQVTVSKVIVNGKAVGVIEVEQSQNLIMTERGAFLRIGETTQAMQPNEIVTRLQPSKTGLDLDAIAKAISRQTTIIEGLQEDLREANSFKSKLKDYFVGGVIGAILGWLVTVGLG